MFAMSDNGNGKKKVLIAEDEEIVRGLFEMMFSSWGFEVITAKNGEEGLKVFSEKKEEISLVISDVVMPEMNGIKMIQEMRKIVPAVKTIVCSGEVPPKLVKDLEDLKVDFFSKPFSKNDLLRKVKILIGESSASL